MRGPAAGSSALLLALLAVACVPSSPAQPDPTVRPSAGPTVSHSPAGAVLPPAPDDRPDSLRRLTARWATDWSRRVIPLGEIDSGGVGRDDIPSIDDPRAVPAASLSLDDEEPVLVVEANGASRIYPIRILTWHEVVNDSLGGGPVVVTFCPLCNSGLAFDRRVDGRVLQFGVSGLLRHSDLIMWDRETESLWQQFEGRAVVGDYAGTQLRPVPTLLLSWSEARAGFPAADVLAPPDPPLRLYGTNPYVGYDASGSEPFLFSGELDRRLPATERVVGMESQAAITDEAREAASGSSDSIAIPFGVLAKSPVMTATLASREIVVFWAPGARSALDGASIAGSRDVGQVGVFRPVVDGKALTFTSTILASASGTSEALDPGHSPRQAAFRDLETGSLWTIAGEAMAGPLKGRRLPTVRHMVPFWFAWAAFHPETRILTAP